MRVLHQRVARGRVAISVKRHKHAATLTLHRTHKSVRKRGDREREREGELIRLIGPILTFLLALPTQQFEVKPPDGQLINKQKQRREEVEEKGGGEGGRSRDEGEVGNRARTRLATRECQTGERPHAD